MNTAEKIIDNHFEKSKVKDYFTIELTNKLGSHLLAVEEVLVGINAPQAQLRLPLGLTLIEKNRKFAIVESFGRLLPQFVEAGWTQSICVNGCCYGFPAPPGEEAGFELCWHDHMSVDLWETI